MDYLPCRIPDGFGSEKGAASTYAFGMGDHGLRCYPNIKAMTAVQPLHHKELVEALGMPGFLRRAACKTSLERLGFEHNTNTSRPT